MNVIVTAEVDGVCRVVSGTPTRESANARNVCTQLWGSDSLDFTLPVSDPTPSLEGVIASPGTVRVNRVRFRPTTAESLGEAAQGQIAAEIGPGGVHATDSVEYVWVLEGEIGLVLDQETVWLSQGDLLVQNGTRHAWRNRGDQDAVIGVVSIGAVRSN